jgi:dynein heavy chain
LTYVVVKKRVRRGVYGAGVGKKAIIYVEDLNMPIKEKYGAQPPLELLRQLADHGFLYNKLVHIYRMGTNEL